MVQSNFRRLIFLFDVKTSCFYKGTTDGIVQKCNVIFIFNNLVPTQHKALWIVHIAVLLD